MNIEKLCRLWKQAFGDSDEFLQDFFCVAFSPQRCCTIEQDGDPASMLYWFDCTWEGRKIAYIYAVATDEYYQNQGFCRLLMEKTHRRLREQGYSGAVLVPGSRALFSLYEKMGYAPFCAMQTMTISAGSEPVDLARLSHEEYSRRRLPLLPAGSVIHGDLTFDFLATFCDFYTVGDCLFCGGMEEDTFYFQEYLGDPCCVGGVLAALGAKKGVLRFPGDTPFAMYRPLQDESEIPRHFDIPLN